MSTRYDWVMSAYNASTSKKGVYTGVTKPGYSYSGHVTIIKHEFNSSTCSRSMRIMYFCSIK